MKRSWWIGCLAATTVTTVVVATAFSRSGQPPDASSEQRRPGARASAKPKPKPRQSVAPTPPARTQAPKRTPHRTSAPPPIRTAPVDCVSGKVAFTSLTVAAGEVLCLDPHADTTITMAGNLVVHGRLEAKPASPGVQHVIRWRGVHESQFVGGGGLLPLDTDPGLWVQGAGVLDLAGTPRTAWNRTGSDPTWRKGDELVVTPTQVGNYTKFASFRAGSPVPYSVGPGRRKQPAEVLNLSRNVRLEGTPAGRAHIHIHSTSPQSLRHVAIRWMGPRKRIDGDRFTDAIPGRQALHLHRNADGSRGTLFEGVVVRDSGGMGIDIHDSHGVTVRGAITYNTNENGIGWTAQERSDDILIEDTVAAKQVPVPSFRGFLVAGIALPPGMRNTIRRSVTVGNLGHATAAGVIWPETVGGLHLPGVWTAEDVVSHNNRSNGVFTWQNSGGDHVVTRFVCYANGHAGVEHGAYVNPYVYRDLLTWDSGEAGLIEHAVSGASQQGQTHQFIGGRVDGMKIVKHTLPATVPVWLRGIDLTRPGGFKLVVDEQANRGRQPGWYEFVDTGLERRDVRLISKVTQSVIRVHDRDGRTWQVE